MFRLLSRVPFGRRGNDPLDPQLDVEVIRFNPDDIRLYRGGQYEFSLTDVQAEQLSKDLVKVLKE